MKIKNFKFNKGFTLVELVIVIAIFSIMLFTIAGFFIMTLQSRGRTQARIEVQDQARALIGRISYDIRRSNGIVATSSFANLAANASSSFAVTSSVASRNPTTFSVLNGILNLRYASGSSTPLTSKDVTVTNLTFTNLSSSNGRSKNVLVNLTVYKIDPTGKAASDINYQVETTVEIMGK